MAACARKGRAESSLRHESCKATCGAEAAGHLTPHTTALCGKRAATKAAVAAAAVRC
jgi:hypothetical protein